MVSYNPGSAPLERLRNDVLAAKSNWETLQDQICIGYALAYQNHKTTLKNMQNKRLEEELAEKQTRQILVFLFSTVATAFAGGVIGGAMAPWVDEATESFANEVARRSLGYVNDSRGALVRKFTTMVARNTTEESAKKISDKLIDAILPTQETDSREKYIDLSDKKNAHPGQNEPYTPAAQDPDLFFLHQKALLDSSFAEAGDRFQKILSSADDGKWSLQICDAMAGELRSKCPLLRDKPDPKKAMSPKFVQSVQNAAELAMWVAWAKRRKFEYWNPIYARMDEGDVFVDDRSIMNEIVDTLDLQPVLDRIRAIDSRAANTVEITMEISGGGGRAGVLLPPRFSPEEHVLNLRKLRDLSLQMPGLPFSQMKNLGQMLLPNVHLELRGKFLDGLRDIRPFHWH